MKNIRLFSLSLVLLSSTVLAQNQIKTTMFQKAKSNIKKNLSFSYGLTYLGPTLSNNYQEGATFNRFNTGQDFKGDDLDPTSSQQLYHSMSIGYQVSKNVNLSYGYTFQDDFNSDIEYNVYNSDGSVFAVNKRKKEVSNNNQRVNAFVTNILSNKYFFLMSNFYYERPTTDASENSDMLYGLGIQPNIGIFTSIPKTYFGVQASVERDYYKRQEYTYNCGTAKCSQKYQTLRASISPYAIYNFTDKLNTKFTISFDWDQDGDQVGTNEFNKNMDDYFEVHTSYTINKNLRVGAGIESSLTEPGVERTALIGKLNVSI